MPVSSLRNELIRTTRTLIDIPSVSRNEETLLEFLLEQMPHPWQLAYRGDAVALLTMGPRTSKPFVIVAGHTDTVPITDNVPSTQDGDVVFGRGACDMKGSLAVMLHMAQVAAASETSDLPMDFDLGLLFFGREELAQADSALLPAFEQCELLASADFAVLMEPTNFALELGCQGNLNLTLHASGTAAHSARPWLGSNAAHNVITVLQELATAEPNDVEINGLVFREVANVTGWSGGVARNVIPGSAQVEVNVRYAPSRDPQEAERSWVDRLTSTTVRVEVNSNSNPAPVVRDHPFAQKLLDAGAHSPMPKQGWTNAADFAAYGIPAVNFGAGDPGYAHKDDEQVTGAALEHCVEVMTKFLLRSNSAQ